jgi:hypothetical protein
VYRKTKKRRLEAGYHDRLEVKVRPMSVLSLQLCSQSHVTPIRAWTVTNHLSSYIPSNALPRLHRTARHSIDLLKALPWAREFFTHISALIVSEFFLSQLPAAHSLMPRPGIGISRSAKTHNARRQRATLGQVGYVRVRCKLIATLEATQLRLRTSLHTMESHTTQQHGEREEQARNSKHNDRPNDTCHSRRQSMPPVTSRRLGIRNNDDIAIHTGAEQTRRTTTRAPLRNRVHHDPAEHHIELTPLHIRLTRPMIEHGKRNKLVVEVRSAVVIVKPHPQIILTLWETPAAASGEELEDNGRSVGRDGAKVLVARIHEHQAQEVDHRVYFAEEEGDRLRDAGGGAAVVLTVVDEVLELVENLCRESHAADGLFV